MDKFTKIILAMIAAGVIAMNIQIYMSFTQMIKSQNGVLNEVLGGLRQLQHLMKFPDPS